MSFVEPITPVVGFFLPKLQRGGNTLYTRYTDEQTKRAGETDLVTLLQHHGQQVRRVGSEYEWLDGEQTVSVKGNLWFHQYERVGGNTIDFVKKFFGLNFPDAVKLILDEEGAEDVSSTEIKRKDDSNT